MTIIFHSIKGLHRDKNQDDTLLIEEEGYYLFFLFDGVSSLQNSISFIQCCKKFINENYVNYFDTSIRLSKLMYDAHCYSINKSELGLSTCSAVYLSRRKNSGVYFNMGDSRIYSFNSSYLEQVSIDDSIIGQPHVITKALGGEGLTLHDFIQSDMDGTGGILMCSDGFYSLMEDNLRRYFNVLQFKRPKNIINALKSLQEGHNSDDSTYILILPHEIRDRA